MRPGTRRWTASPVAATGSAHNDEVLIEVLRRAQDLGFVGPAVVQEQVEHGDAFARALERAWSRRAGADSDPRPPLRQVADLGSGGGLPALVVASRWPDVRLTLVEAQHRRAEFLQEAILRLGLGQRAVVIAQRAETVGRNPEHRGKYQVVTARSFGPPAVVAECAAPLLRTGGALLVSEPPTTDAGQTRWPVEGLTRLGMGPAEFDQLDEGRRHFVALPQLVVCPEEYPRRVGVPAKRPLF